MTDTYKTRLKFFFDFADPLSYILSTQAEGWCRRVGWTVEWLPLRSSFTNDHFAQRRATASSLATALRFPLFHRSDLDSSPALRASVLARGAGTLAQFVMRVFQFWYATDLPPYADILFDGLAADCNLSRTDLRDALQQDTHWTSKALSEIETSSRPLQINSTPTIVLPDETTVDFGFISETHPLEDVIQLLSASGLPYSGPTAAARCYLPSNTDQPERFCRWCTCERKL